MGLLIHNGRKLSMSDDALRQLQDAMTNAWTHRQSPLRGIGLWATVNSPGDERSVRTWFSPTHDIRLVFDGPAPGGPAPVIDGVDLDGELRELLDDGTTCDDQ